MTPDPASCYSKALSLLARRAHFRSELEAKLHARGYPHEEVALALDRLAAAALLDDRQCARAFIEERQRRGAVARLWLTAELGRRGVDPVVIDECLADWGDDDELAQARRAADSWLGRARREDSGRDALARHLDRKGFSPHVILAVLGER